MNQAKQPSLSKQLVVAIAIILALGTAQFFLWNFVYQSADALHTRRTEEQQLQALKAIIADVQTKFAAEKPLVDQLSVPFPKNTQTSQVVDRLEQLADKTGVLLNITNISTETPNKKTPNQLNSFVATLKVDGSAHSLLQYIDAVEHIQEVTTIRQWAIVGVPPSATVLPGQPPPAPLFTMNMNILFYLQP